MYAVFLVAPEDRYAHDVFRAFRSSFENLGASFEHLVIFGQHGVSSTVLGLLDQVGHSLKSLPMLALFSGPPADEFQFLPLPKGSTHKHSEESAGELIQGSEQGSMISGGACWPGWRMPPLAR